MDDSVVITKSYWTGWGMGADYLYPWPSAVGPCGGQPHRWRDEQCLSISGWLFLRRSGDLNLGQWETLLGLQGCATGTALTLEFFPLSPFSPWSLQPAPFPWSTLPLLPVDITLLTKPSSRVATFTARVLPAGGLQFLLSPAGAAVSPALSAHCSVWWGFRWIPWGYG